MTIRSLVTVWIVSLLSIACSDHGRGAASAEVNEALAEDGAQRFCGLGRPLVEGDADVALFPRLTLRSDGFAELERILGRTDHPPVAYPDRFAPLIEGRVPWRGGGFPRLSFGRVDPRLVFAERGQRRGGVLTREQGTLPGARPPVSRQAIRVRVLYSETQRGPALTLLPCAGLSPALAGTLDVGPRWELDLLIGAAEYRRRRAPLAGDPDRTGLAPRDGVTPRALDAADRAERWCAVDLEFDSFRPRRLRTFAFVAGRPRSSEYVYDAEGVRARPGAAARLQPVRDGRGTPLFIDLNRPDFTDGWFRPCTDPELVEFTRPFAGVAF